MAENAPAPSTRFAPLELPRRLAEAIAGIPHGRLQVNQRGAQRSVWFQAEKIRAITSSLDAERLGEWLVERGIVDRRAIQQALSHRQSGERFGAALVGRGFIAADRLAQELEMLTNTIAARMAFEEGEFRIDAADLPDDALGIDQPPLTLFAAALRRAPDSGQFERLTGGGKRWAVSPHAATAQEDDVTPFERFLLTRLTAPTSLQDARALAPQQVREVPRALACLVLLGFVAERTTEEGGSPATPEASAKPEFPPASPDLREVLEKVDPRRPAPAAQEEAQPIDPEKVDEAKREAFTMLERGGDARRAHKLLAAAVEMAADPVSLCTLADLEMANPLWRSKALDRLKNAVTIAPQFTQAWLMLANYWSTRGQPEKQRRCLQRILAYEPSNEGARQAIELLDATHKN
ncbi:MAG: hypothetical protein ACHQQS_12730 [Thermoanaerobaculales bacterium]